MKTKIKLLMLLGLLIFHRQHLILCIWQWHFKPQWTYLYLGEKNPNTLPDKKIYPGNLFIGYYYIGLMSESKMESLAYCHHFYTFLLYFF